MAEIQNSLSNSMKLFHRRVRSPIKVTASVNYINVYKTSANVSMTCPNLNTENTLEKSQQVSNLNTQASVFLPQRTLTRSLKIKQTQPIIAHEKVPQIHSIFKKKKINLEKITQLSQKESIIFNQVKNVAPVRNQVVNTEVIMNTEMIRLTRMRTNKYKKLSTMRRVQMSESNNPSECIEETVPTNPTPAKRKKLKHRVWRWVAAGGDVVY